MEGKGRVPKLDGKHKQEAYQGEHAADLKKTTVGLRRHYLRSLLRRINSNRGDLQGVPRGDRRGLCVLLGHQQLGC